MLLLQVALIFLPLRITGQSEMPSVDDLLAAHREALGGDRIADINYVYLEKEVVSGNYKAQQQIWLHVDTAIAAKTQTFGQTITMVYDRAAEDAWQINPYLNTGELPADLDQKGRLQLQLQMAVFGPLYQPGKDTKLSLKEVKETRKHTYYVIEATYASGFQEQLYIDSETHLIDRVVNKLGTTYFQDYRTYGGVQFPTYAETSSSQGTMIIRTSQITLNAPETADYSFERPSKR